LGKGKVAPFSHEIVGSVPYGIPRGFGLKNKLYYYKKAGFINKSYAPKLGSNHVDISAVSKFLKGKICPPATFEAGARQPAIKCKF
jgi:hypothetical protein